MNRADAACHAWHTTQALWRRLELTPFDFGADAWLTDLADFLDRAPDSSAEVLYRHVMGIRIKSVPWDRANPHVRVCLEIFRATYLALMVLVRAEEAAVSQSGPTIQKPLADRGIGKRAMRKRGGLRKRVQLARPAAAAAPAVSQGATKEPGAKRNRAGAKAPSASRP